MKSRLLHIVCGDDSLWYIEGDEGIFVLRGPYANRKNARRALRNAKMLAYGYVVE